MKLSKARIGIALLERFDCSDMGSPRNAVRVVERSDGLTRFHEQFDVSAHIRFNDICIFTSCYWMKTKRSTDGKSSSKISKNLTRKCTQP